MEYVYVLEFPDCVKIGYSAHIDKRIKQVEHMVGEKAINVYYTEATRDTENAMHRFFESHRVERECFREFFSVSFNEAKETLLDMIHHPERYPMEQSKQTPKKKAYDIQYRQENMKRVPLEMKKDQYADLQAAADSAGMKINEYIKVAIREKVERDGAEFLSGADPEKPTESP